MNSELGTQYSELVLATSNPGKVREFRRLLAGLPLEILTPADLGLHLEVEEDSDTYAGNATLKARAYAEAGHCLALADDSGIEVDALDGRPGVRSARYGGTGLDDEGRTRRLLDELRDIPPERRTARYRAVVAIAEPGSTSVELFEGTWEGCIAGEPAGSGGFGYDPVFLLPAGRTSAQLTPEEKDAVSHRGIAVRAAAAWLRDRLA